jgi:hypothetical protein
MIAEPIVHIPFRLWVCRGAACCALFGQGKPCPYIPDGQAEFPNAVGREFGE